MKTKEIETRELNYELYLLHTICRFLQQTLDEEQILHIILTGITAGRALGFSRAFLLFLDKPRHVLYGKTGIGPANAEEASRIWQELEKADLALEDLFQNSHRLELQNQQFAAAVRKIVINLEDLPPGNYLPELIRSQKAIHRPEAKSDPNIPEEIRSVLVPSEIVLLPLVTGDETLGIVAADNAFHHRPIADDTIRFLALICGQAGLALQNALRYQSVKAKLEQLEQLHTALKRMQAELMENERLATIGKMATYLAHEIRNPLVTIGGFAANLVPAPERATVERDARIIVQEIKKLELFLNNFMSFSFLPVPKLTALDLRAVIEEIMPVFSLEIERKNIQVNLALEENVTVRGDRVQLREVFFNLVSNALESMDRGALGIRSKVRYPYVEVLVTDTGKGIPTQDLPHVTKPFFSTKPHGGGLGLSIVHNIVERHHGQLEITSKPGAGTTVCVRLPIQEVPNEKEDPVH